MTRWKVKTLYSWSNGIWDFAILDTIEEVKKNLENEIKDPNLIDIVVEKTKERYKTDKELGR